MKTIKLYFLIVILSFMSGCALLSPKAKIDAVANIASPTVYVDGKVIENGQKVVGDFSAETKKGSVYLKSFNFWSFLGGFGVWFFVGGMFLLVGIISAIWFKAFKIALAAFASGGIVLLGAFFLKLFWVALAWITAILCLCVAALSVIHYRSQIIGAAKDVIDDGKLNKSS